MDKHSYICSIPLFCPKGCPQHLHCRSGHILSPLTKHSSSFYSSSNAGTWSSVSTSLILSFPCPTHHLLSSPLLPKGGPWRLRHALAGLVKAIGVQAVLRPQGPDAEKRGRKGIPRYFLGRSQGLLEAEPLLSGRPWSIGQRQSMRFSDNTSKKATFYTNKRTVSLAKTVMVGD